VRPDDDPIDVPVEQVAIIKVMLRSGRLPARKVTAEPCQYDGLNIRRRDASHVACLFVAALQQGMGHVVSIAHPTLVGMRRGHPIAAVVKDATH
jgi:hypothetical protein